MLHTVEKRENDLISKTSDETKWCVLEREIKSFSKETNSIIADASLASYHLRTTEIIQKGNTIFFKIFFTEIGDSCLGWTNK